MFPTLGYNSLDLEVHTTHSEDETILAGRKFAARLHAGDVIALYGTLGAGKTEFVKGICEYFHVEDVVSSPTFTIMNQYDGMQSNGDDVKLYHVDLYRINSKREFSEIGFSECMNAPDAIKLVEWAEKANDEIPANRYTISFDLDNSDENIRHISISHQGEQVLAA
ncbi:MAG: tRNA (adenosine(37)-N6)-threonylcarbamoyltransferase complex ATPase subunit type 1 TsaE [Candidatus Kapabacteria bacterium]|nr:tRNA (adenosine(37)-N6)-threonylcarbamoyltransferase complex ATPase subunit type 1 TsaE [Candidatus Kapabacteria bacterium]